MRKFRDNQYFNLGVMLLTVIASAIVLLAIVLNLSGVMAVLRMIWNAFSPVISGLVMAYLLNPLMNFMDRRLCPLLRKKMEEQKACKLSRAISMVFALVFAGILVYEFCAMLLPQLYESVVGIIGNLSTYFTEAETWVMGFLEDNPELSARADQLLGQFYTFLENWINNTVLGNINTIFTGLTTSVMSVVGVLLDLLIGLAAAVYMLWSRDLFIAQAKKLTVASFRARTADYIFDLARRIHKVFSGFIIGKLVDSLIIGILCYLGMLVLRLPFPALVATVVGVTNVIPFFGPFIGAIPCAVLILLVNPLQGLYFILFVFALQQLDGNVIGPRILGDTIGISGFWVLVSITVAGSLFGFAGMLLGVPVFAVFYMLVNEFVVTRLRKKGHAVQTAAYDGIVHVEDVPALQEAAAEQEA